MTQTITIKPSRPLSASELQEVRDFVASVAGRPLNAGTASTASMTTSSDSQPPATIERDGEVYLDVDKIAGMFAWFDPGKSAVDLVHEANEAEARKYDKYFE